MNLPKINITSPCRRNLTHANRLMSCSTNSKSTTSSSKSIKSKDSHPLPVLIQLCLDSDENYAYHTMFRLLSPRHLYSPNVSDEFGCNVLMYSLRYQRYRLFDLFLSNGSLELNLQAKDQHGNTILHYAMIYSGNDSRIIEKLIEKYQKFAIKIDERNELGFTPLLLAAFCGRYDLVLTLLTKTDASPFVRDYIQSKNIFDYIEMDMKHKEFPSSSNPELKRLIQQLYQTLPSRGKIYAHKNFFEIFLHRSIEDQTGLFRSLIIDLLNFDSRTNLLNYLNQRYPRIPTSGRIKDLPPTRKFVLQKENSKIDIHNLLNLFDPTLKSKAVSPPEKMSRPSKASLKFRKLSTKITTMSAFARTEPEKKRSSLTATRVQ